MKIKSLAMAGVLLCLSVFAFTVPVSAVTCPKGTALSGSSASTLAECNIENDNSLIPTILRIIQVTIGVLALVAVVVIVLSGVQYTTSAGDPGKVKKAKDSILYGIIGLVIAILAFSIVNFVLSSLTKTDPVTKPNTTVEPEKGDEGKDGEEDKKEDGTKTTVIEGSDDKSTLRTKENIAPNAKETNK